MAKLPAIHRLSRENIPNAPDWINQVIGPVNLFMYGVFSALNKQLTFGDNIWAQTKNLEFTTASDYTTNKTWTTLKFTSTLGKKATGCILLQIQDVTTTAYNPITDAVYIDWLDDNGTININFVTGLSDSKDYSLTVLLI